MAAIEQGGLRTQEPWTDFAHTGPGMLAGRYMRSFWQPVRRAQDLAPGRAVPIQVMSEQLTLYRGETGLPHLLAFRCAHRGTQLSTGWVEGDDLRCFYHGWKYDGGGQCVEQPAEPEPFCQRIRIRSYPVHEYLGLIFAYLGEGEPPSPPRYPEFDEPGIVENTTPGFWPCNYFNRIENSPDPVHLAFVHRASNFADHGLVGIPEGSGEETDYGIELHARRPNEQVRVTHFHMPNMNFFTTAGSDWDPDPDAIPSNNLAWRVPVDDEHCVSFYVVHIPAGRAAEQYEARRRSRPKDFVPPPQLGDAVLRGERRIDDITEPTNLINVQDYVAQVGQGAIAPREIDHLGRSDVTLILLRRIWERELRALAEGRPLKQWGRADRVEAVFGA